MSAYHATHPSPFDDACPECAGYTEFDYRAESRRMSRRLLPVIALLAVVLGLVYWGTR